MRGLSFLAFAAGYRRVSFVFIEDGQLATWQTSKRAALNPEEAASFAREFIDLLLPTFIVMEDTTAETRKGARTQALLKVIKDEAARSPARLLPMKREKLFDVTSSACSFAFEALGHEDFFHDVACVTRKMASAPNQRWQRSNPSNNKHQTQDIRILSITTLHIKSKVKHLDRSSFCSHKYN